MSHRPIAAVTILSIISIGSLGIAQGSQPRTEAQGTTQVDHVIVAVPNLEEGIARIEEMTGVRPVFGGRHPGAGTQNALMALGPRLYLEILAPQTRVGLPPDRRWMLQLERPTPAGFAISTTDMTSTVALLERNGFVTSDPAPGSRARPDGVTLEWTSMAITEPAIPGAPFFIQWDPGSPHPATTSPRGCVLRSLTVVTSEHAALERLAGLLGVDVVVEGGTGPEERYEIELGCPEGPVVFQ